MSVAKVKARGEQHTKKALWQKGSYKPKVSKARLSKEGMETEHETWVGLEHTGPYRELYPRDSKKPSISVIS